MLKSFLSLGSQPSSFSRYLISNDTDFVSNHCGKYPVIYLNLKDCKGETWDQMYQEVWLCIRDMVEIHQDLVEAIGRLDPNELNFNKRTPPSYFADVLKWLIKSL